MEPLLFCGFLQKQRKLHIFANRLLLRRDIQQSQCRSNHRIKIDSMLCPDVRIHKYLNKHGIQPLRQQSSLIALHFINRY